MEDKYRKIIEKLNNHGIVCFPTETVMGLGIIYDDYLAYQKLNIIKKRSEDKPYTMMLSSTSEIEKYAFVNKKIKRVIDRFMPGSITLLLPAKENVPEYVTHHSGVIGIRIPTNKEAIDLLTAINKPLLVPSANKAGETPALNISKAKAIFHDEVDVYIDGCSLGEKPSTIVDLTTNEAKLIRKGPIPFVGIKAIFDGHKFDDTVVMYLFKNDEVLMLHRNKKINDINEGKYIGVGGHVEKNETPEQAVKRELKEETNLELLAMNKVGKITFYFHEDVEIMNIFTSNEYQGAINYNCDEGTLKWIKIKDIFKLPLWEGDKLFLEPILNNEPYFEFEMKYDKDSLVEYKRII